MFAWPRLPPCQPCVCNPCEYVRLQHLNAYVLLRLRPGWLPDMSAIVTTSSSRPDRQPPPSFLQSAREQFLN